MSCSTHCIKNSDKLPSFSRFYRTHTQWRAEGGERDNGPGNPRKGGIIRVNLHFTKLLKIYAFSYRKSSRTCCMDLIESCLGGHDGIMFRSKSSAVSAFVLKLLFSKFQLVCSVQKANI